MTHITFFVTLFIFVTLTSCGVKNPRDTIFVEGTVKVDGLPTADVSVTFVPRCGEVSAGGLTDDKGNFTLSTAGSPNGSSALAGEYDVTFFKYEVEGIDLSPAEYEKQFGNQMPKTLYIVPEEFGDTKTSGIEPVNVEKEKKNRFDFDLKTK